MIKFNPISPEYLPRPATPGSAGLDLIASEEVYISPGFATLVDVGFTMEMPVGIEAQIRPRSGLALKHQVTVLNSPGTIDSDYREPVKVLLINHGNKEFHVEKGMRIAQMVLAPYVFPRVSSLQESREGGFGSTGDDTEEHF